MSTALSAPPLARAVAERSLAPSGDASLDAAAARLVAAAGESIRGLIFFGSRRTGAVRADAWSAYDVMVVVSAYAPFYRGAAAAGLTSKPPWLMALVSRWLAPTQCSFHFADAGVHVKASVIDEATLVRETSAARRDHFCAGRLFQPASLIHVRDDAARESLLGCLVSAVRQTWPWSRPWQPERFDTESYGRSALRTSLSFEVRPEPPGRAEQLFDAQRALQVPVLDSLLCELSAQGEIAPAGAPGGWSARRPVGSLERLRLNAYFRLSMARTTARWLKHVVSFEGWLDYIVRKASRHTGQELALSERERRYPLIFLWGRVFRFLAEQRKGKGKAK